LNRGIGSIKLILWPKPPGTRSTKKLTKCDRGDILVKSPATSSCVLRQFSVLVQNLRKHLEFSPKTCIRWLYPVLVHIFRDSVDITQRFPTGTITTSKYKMHFQLKVHFTILVAKQQIWARSITADPKVRPWIVFTNQEWAPDKKGPAKSHGRKHGFAGVRELGTWLTKRFCRRALGIGLLWGPRGGAPVWARYPCTRHLRV